MRLCIRIIRQELIAKIGVRVADCSEYQFSSSHPADKLASTLCLFWLQSKLFNLADKPDVYSLLLHILCLRLIAVHRWPGGEKHKIKKYFLLKKYIYIFSGASSSWCIFIGCEVLCVNWAWISWLFPFWPQKCRGHTYTCNWDIKFSLRTPYLISVFLSDYSRCADI